MTANDPNIPVPDNLSSDRILPLATLQRQQAVTEVRDVDDLRGRVEDTDDFGPFLAAIRSARNGEHRL